MSTNEKPTLTPEENLNRHYVLADLARLDGRDETDHPRRGTYSALARPFNRLADLEEQQQAASALLLAMTERLELITARLDALDQQLTAGKPNG